MNIIRICNTQRITYNFKCWLLSNKMVLIKSFPTKASYDRSKFTYMYLNEGDKIRECHSCLKVMIQAHLHVGFSKYVLWTKLNKATGIDYLGLQETFTRVTTLFLKQAVAVVNKRNQRRNSQRRSLTKADSERCLSDAEDYSEMFHAIIKI